MLPPIWLALHGHLLWWAALALLLAAGWHGERALRRWRSRRAWRARAGGLPRASAASETGADVRVSGTLRLGGAAARRFEDGAPTAVASAVAGPRAEQDAACVSVRADRLWLDTSEGPIELRGAMHVVGGRSIRTAGVPEGLAWSRVSAALGEESDWPFTSLAVELRSVAAGDRVEVAGRLERAVDGDASDYRSTMRRVLVPSDGPMLVQLDAPIPARAWRGPLIGTVLYVIANMLLVPIPQRWAGDVSSLSLVSPITRPRALEALETSILEEAEAALSSESLLPVHAVALAQAIASEQPCAERARLLRASGDLEAALREAEACHDPQGGSERTLALFALGREREAVASWEALLRDVDARCADSDRCDLAAMELATVETPLDWGSYHSSDVPRGLFLGWTFDRPAHVAYRLHGLLQTMELRSSPMRAARIAWSLELAAFEIELDHHRSAGALLEEAYDRLVRGELPAAATDPLLRDTVHLRTVLALRGHHLDEARRLLHANEGSSPCAMRDLVAAAESPFEHGAEANVQSRYTYDRVRRAFVDLSAPPVESWIGMRESLAWIDHFGRVARPAHAEQLLAHLGSARCRGEDATREDAAWDAALARAHQGLGAGEAPAQIRGCVEVQRRALLGQPPLERYR